MSSRPHTPCQQHIVSPHNNTYYIQRRRTTCCLTHYTIVTKQAQTGIPSDATRQSYHYDVGIECTSEFHASKNTLISTKFDERKLQIHKREYMCSHI
mmetsp:Transcript_14951/g.19289  ORF Transcript_14951/g.19289 Transcript_14951/m.19289 type:complete len:97 (-) Transcript_14951:110-400(-)